MIGKKRKKRVGRGPGSGHGKTSGRGHKGQKARSGKGARPGFEGGQTPLIRRIPKRGFTRISKRMHEIVNLHALNRCEKGFVVTPKILKDLGLIKRPAAGLKVLGGGQILVPLTVKAHAFSKEAKAKIEAAGGKAEVLGHEAKVTKTKSETKK